MTAQNVLRRAMAIMGQVHLLDHVLPVPSPPKPLETKVSDQSQSQTTTKNPEGTTTKNTTQSSTKITAQDVPQETVRALQYEEFQRLGSIAMHQISYEIARAEYGKDLMENWRPYVLHTDDLMLSRQATTNIMPYGVAMIIAQGERDFDMYEKCEKTYNTRLEKFKAQHCKHNSVTDVLP